MNPVLSFKELSLTLKGKPLLHDVNMALNAGEILGLVGRSGSGKSMTALAAMGLTPDGAQLTGAIEFNGENLVGKSDKALCAIRGKRIAMIFQEPMSALNPLQTIGAQVAEAILVHANLTRADAFERAETLLNRVGLASDMVSGKRYPHELSGGQRQRVVIAIAIAMRPSVLIADEPTTALDVITQAEILALLHDLARQENIALMLITHDLTVMSNMADRIAVMKDGTIVAENSAKMFFGDTPPPQARDLFAKQIAIRASQNDNEASDDPLLQATGLVCAYDQQKRSLFSPSARRSAVSDVSLCIGKAERVGLVGPSGCGKSTLARALMALSVPDAGSVMLDGVQFPNPSKAEMHRLRRKIQIVFQDPYSSFNPRHRIGRIIAEPLSLLEPKPTRAQMDEKVAAALEDVGLSRADAMKYPYEFSGGQRQRIAIARALITEPELIILDEATSALDVVARNKVLALMAKIAETRAVACLIITHDLSIIRGVADRVAIMDNGRIVEEGPTDAIFASPHSATAKALIKAAPPLHGPPALPPERKTI